MPTVSVCDPAARSASANGARHGVATAPSSEQSKRLSGWLPRNMKLAVVLRETASGPLMICVSGEATALNVMSSTEKSVPPHSVVQMESTTTDLISARPSEDCTTAARPNGDELVIGVCVGLMRVLSPGSPDQASTVTESF